ncbi:allergin-1 isoform X2 [Dasypus novemcinctus]|uniref:allergin-1 isoform X2 n=1 Tax=Dasypus novemcinctus TaxID=9361 RepID=UPI00265F5772|nr:allergin-1 isoform X2 [Dasypus novemcinctus]
MPHHNCATPSPQPSSLISSGNMWSHLNKLFFWGIFSLVTFQKAATDCKTSTNKFTSPRLYSKTREVTKDQNVSLVCSIEDKSMNITYSLFWGEKHLATQDGEGGLKIFNLKISEARDLGPYKCKAQFFNCSKYSYEFNFISVEPVATPVLEIKVIQTGTDRHITLRCISRIGSLPINYTFFDKNVTISPTISKNVRVHAEFNFTRKSTGEVEKYRCKAKNRLPNNAKYSQPITIPLTGGDNCPFCLQLLLPGLFLVLIIVTLILAFWILPKYKARKAMGIHVPKDCGDTPMEVEEYANICTNHEGNGHSQEIHYASIMLGKVAPGAHETYDDDKTGFVYSELTF